MLKRLGRLGLAALTLITAPIQADDAESLARERWYQAIDQGYDRLADASERLEASARRFCTQSDAPHREKLVQDWLDAYQAWQGVRFVDFGPVELNSRAWQLQFWPDRKNLVGSKVDAWLKAKQAPSAEQIADDSVAIQGFPALEYLLYDPKMDGGETLTTSAACGLLQAIATHVADTTGALRRDWRSFAERYQGTDSYTTASLQASLHTLETLETKRLGDPMGLTGGPRNGYLAEAWRSGQSIRLIEATLAGLESSFLPGLRPLLQSRGEGDLADDFHAALERARERAASMPPGLAPRLDDAEAYSDLQGLYVQLSQLSRQAREIGAVLGLVRGFNSSDGD